MIDIKRIEELQQEIGVGDLDFIIRVFLGEAEEKLAGLTPCLAAEERARTSHFLRSGALNIGLSGIAALAVRLEGGGIDLESAIADLRAALDGVRTEFRLQRD